MTVITGPEGTPPPDGEDFHGFEIATQDVITPDQFPELLRDFVIDQDALPEGTVGLPVGSSVELFVTPDDTAELINQTAEQRYANPRIQIGVARDGFEFSIFSNEATEHGNEVMHTRGMLKNHGVTDYQKAPAGKASLRSSTKSRANEQQELEVMRHLTRAFTDENYTVRVRTPKSTS